MQISSYRYIVTTDRWRPAATLLLGVWLLISPWGLLASVETGIGTLNAWAIGAALVLFVPVQLVRREAELGWIPLLLGVWLATSPWVLGYTDALPLSVNALLTGVAIAALAWPVVTHLPVRSSDAAPAGQEGD